MLKEKEEKGEDKWRKEGLLTFGEHLLKMKVWLALHTYRELYAKCSRLYI
jgi:hypothetical protein